MIISLTDPTTRNAIDLINVMILRILERLSILYKGIYRLCRLYMCAYMLVFVCTCLCVCVCI